MEPQTIAPNARAAVFAAVCTLLAAAAHRSMSASAIPAAVMVPAVAVVFCFARVATACRGERRLASIALLVGGSQLGLHLLFEAAQVHDALGAGSGMASMPGMSGMAGMDGMPGMAYPAGVSGAVGTSGPGLLGTTYGMTIAHVLAASVTAWWLRRGEAALFAAVERAGAVLGASWRLLAEWVAGARPIGPGGVAARASRSERRRLPRARVLFFTVIRRGPPAAVVR